MTTRVAAHGRRGSFSERWVAQSTFGDAEIVEVDGFSPKGAAAIRDCDVLLWHLSHDSQTDLLFARSVLTATEEQGLVVFPNHSTRSHFDDKVAQKFLLEAVGAPVADSWVFFSRNEALSWTETAEFPLVFKLRRGAGALNVRLVRTRSEARKLIRKMFGLGISSSRGGQPSVAEIRKKVKIETSAASLWRKARNHVLSRGRRMLSPDREKGYVYFQRFVKDNDFDIRVTVIGERAFVFHRMNRRGDFRASGSGNIDYCAPGGLDHDCVEIAFETSRALGFQSMAYDFVVDPETKECLILEISYVFNAKAIFDCSGYLDPLMTWHDGHCWPQDLILEDVIAEALSTRALPNNHAS